MIKALLIDDDLDFLDFMEKNLEDLSDFEIEIETLNTSEKVIQELEKDDFDVIISDYKMPKLNGLKLLKKVREEGFTTPFVLITGEGNEDIAKKALNYEADKYLEKSDDFEEQKEIIKDAIFENEINS